MPSATKLRRRNLQILFNNTTLIPFKWRGKYLCFYCGEYLPNHTFLRQHTITHGTCSDDDRAIKLVKSAENDVKIDVSIIKCNLCNKEIDSLDNTIDHLSVKHKLPYDKNVTLEITAYRLFDLKCLHCDQQFTFFGNLIIHVNNDHPTKRFKCNECDHKFNKQRDMATHIRTYHRQSYKCQKCSATFQSQVQLNTHKLNGHASVCNICFKYFPSGTKRLKHMKADHELVGLQCGLCRKVVSTKQRFLQHATSCAVIADNAKTPQDTNNEQPLSLKQIRNDLACILNMSTAIPFKYFMTKFRCFYCSKDFSDSDDLKVHTTLKHPVCDINFKSMRLLKIDEGCIKIDTSYLSCKACHEPMPDLMHLINHLCYEHKAIMGKSVADQLQHYNLIKDNYPCPICGKVYRHFAMLLRHVSVSHTDNKNICPHCGICFRYRTNLRAHISRRHKPAAFTCLHCSMRYTSNSDLRIHLGKEHGVKVAKCSQCKETFTSRYSMQRHLLVAHRCGHKCMYCDKLFVRNSFMIDHIRRTHLKEKNFECPFCLEKFFDGPRLKMHMVKHYGERNFHCDLCGKKFLWKKNLRDHMSSHIKKSNTTTTNLR